MDTKPGRYIIGVSGGIDSMVLFHMLTRKGGYELIPVYVDHGWRDTTADWAVVRNAAKNLGIDPVRVDLILNSKSEEEARIERYNALRDQASKFCADGIITGHHHDDLIETVIINVLRGTGRQGLTPFSDSSIIRPLLKISRSEIEQYAKDNNIEWVDDPTNEDTDYFRNRTRKIIIPQLIENNKAALKNIEKQITEAAALNKEVDAWLSGLLESGSQTDNSISLPHKQIINHTPEMLQEVIVFAARKLDPAAEINRRAVEQLAIDLKNRRVKKPRALSKRLFASASHDTFTIAFKAR